jgi:hypothetical protein
MGWGDHGLVWARGLALYCLIMGWEFPGHFHELGIV